MKRRREEEIFECPDCNYETKKQNNFTRHLDSDRHKRATGFFSLDNNGTESDTESDFTSPCSRSPVIAHRDVTGDTLQPNSHHDDGVQHDQEQSSSDEEYECDTGTHSTCTNTQWSPFTSKLEMLLYILLHSKTHTLSDETAKYVWYVMKESGISMPSFHAVKNMSFGNLTPDSLLGKGNGSNGMPFWYIKPSSLIKLAVSHPATSAKLIRYGRFADIKCIREQADGKKWKMKIKGISARFGDELFFKGDYVVDTRTNEIGKITNFLQHYETSQMHAEVMKFDRIGNSNTNLICPEDDNLVKKDLKFLKWYDAEKLNFYKYSEEAVQLDSVSEVEKNDLRSKSPFHGDKVVYTVPVNFFMDDTSSNVSKRWSPLHCIQMQLAGIPVSERQLADNIKFISASTDVAILEMMKPVVDELIEIKRIGIDAFDAYNKEVVKVTSDLGLCVCDYSMLAEASNHMGANTNKFCPRCHAEKASGDFRKGLERTPAESSRILQRLSVNDRKDVRQQYGLKPYPNCLWDVINPHSDIPVGLLHWMFLGLGKHLLKACIQDLNEDQQQKLQLLLESMDQSSFTVKLSPDIVKHIDSRQGKDIKQYIQIAPYHMKLARLPVNKVKLLCRLAEICKMVVDKTDFACQDIEVIDNLIEEYLMSLKEVYPSLMSKVKSHLSSHVVEDIESHGPLLAYTEDGFEKTHGRIRGQIFQQNQHARSRDTAHSFMEMEVLNHIISGGYFLNKEEEWVQASSDVRTLSTSKEIKSFLGQKTDGAELLTATLIKAERSLNRKVVKKDLTDDIKNTASLYTTNTGLIMTSYHGIKCKNGEVINQGNPVYCQDENDSAKKYIGLFNEGYHIKGEQERFQLVKIQLFEILPTDERMGFQAIRLKLSNNFKFTKVENVLQTLCIIHDCLSGGCHKKECVQTIRVEQEKTDVKKLVWYHSPLNKNYYLNRFRFSHDVKIC